MYHMTIQTGLGVAPKLRAIAAEKRVKQTDLANVLNVSRISISRRFNGDVPLTDRELIILAEYLNVPVGAFFGEVA